MEDDDDARGRSAKTRKFVGTGRRRFPRPSRKISTGDQAFEKVTVERKMLGWMERRATKTPMLVLVAIVVDMDAVLL